MAYIGNDLQVAFQSYKVIDDISSSFNGSATSFALLVSGTAPVPFPLNSQQCLISVAGVIQRPDDSGTEGFRLSGGNIVFSSAPATGADFFGVILAGADYVNAGGTFPDGSAAVPSITFNDDTDTGVYRSGANQVSVSTGGTERTRFTSNGELQSVNLGTAAAPVYGFVNDPNTGIYSPGEDEVAISTNGTERLRIDSSGRLLVGTSTSSGANATIQSIGTHPLSVHRGFNGTGGPNFSFTKSRNTTYGSNTIVNDGDDLGTIQFRGDDGTDYISAAAYIQGQVDGTPGADDMPGRLVFSTTADGASSPTARAIIDSSGRLLIGTSTSLTTNALIQAYKSSGTLQVLADSDSLADNDFVTFSVNGGARAADFGVYKHTGITNPCAYAGLRTEDNVGNYLWVDNSDILRISTNSAHIGTTSGTVVGTQTSDERIKNILGPVEYGLDTLKQIEPVRYSLKSEPETEKLGFIAQQVQPLVPQSVFDTGEHIEGEPEDAPTKLGMEYVALIPVLVNAIKELSAENEILKARLDAAGI